MIKAINYGVAISDEGFKIKKDRSYLSYIEGNHSVRINRCVLQLNPHTVRYDLTTLKNWYKPHENERIPSEKIELIIKRVQEALSVLLNQDEYEYEIRRTNTQIIAIQKPVDRVKRMQINEQQIEGIRKKIQSLNKKKS